MDQYTSLVMMILELSLLIRISVHATPSSEIMEYQGMPQFVESKVIEVGQDLKELIAKFQTNNSLFEINLSKLNLSQNKTTNQIKGSIEIDPLEKLLNFQIGEDKFSFEFDGNYPSFKIIMSTDNLGILTLSKYNIYQISISSNLNRNLLSALIQLLNKDIREKVRKDNSNQTEENIKFINSTNENKVSEYAQINDYQIKNITNQLDMMNEENYSIKLENYILKGENRRLNNINNYLANEKELLDKINRKNQELIENLKNVKTEQKSQEVECKIFHCYSNAQIKELKKMIFQDSKNYKKKINQFVDQKRAVDINMIEIKKENLTFQNEINKLKQEICNINLTLEKLENENNYLKKKCLDLTSIIEKKKTENEISNQKNFKELLLKNEAQLKEIDTLKNMIKESESALSIYKESLSDEIKRSNQYRISIALNNVLKENQSPAMESQFKKIVF